MQSTVIECITNAHQTSRSSSASVVVTRAVRIVRQCSLGRDTTLSRPFDNSSSTQHVLARPRRPKSSAASFWCFVLVKTARTLSQTINSPTMASVERTMVVFPTFHTLPNGAVHQLQTGLIGPCSFTVLSVMLALKTLDQ